MITVKRNQKEHHFKYSHAWDDYGNYVSRENAINDKRNYYVHKDKQVSLYLKTSSNGNLHWVAYPNQDWRDRNNVVHKWSKVEKIITESYEHRKFKGSIIENGFFYYKKNKVLIKNGDEECRIVNSKFRSDVSAELLDNTPCIVEVIKTSDLSEEKFNHIEKNQILTFKIYIDEYGNQISKRDYIFGNKQVEEINSRIRDGEGKISELRETNKERRKAAKEVVYSRIHEFRNWITQRKENYSEEVERLNEQCRQITNGESSEIKQAEQRNESLRYRIEFKRKQVDRITRSISEIKSEIERIEGEINTNKEPKQDKRYEVEISRNRNECRTLEKTFIKIAESCKVEWFRNKWMTAPVINKISELKYWTS